MYSRPQGKKNQLLAQNLGEFSSNFSDSPISQFHILKLGFQEPEPL